MWWQRSVTLIPAVALAAAMSPTTVATQARTYVIVIDKMKFGPVPAELHVGDTILWLNRDRKSVV